MKNLNAAAIIILVMLFASVSFAAEKAPQIIQFSNSWSGANQNGKAAEADAIKYANEWLKTNSKKVRVISHSVSGNSGITMGVSASFGIEGSNSKQFVPMVNGSTGFSTVTILYIEK